METICAKTTSRCASQLTFPGRWLFLEKAQLCLPGIHSSAEGCREARGGAKQPRFLRHETWAWVNILFPPGVGPQIFVHVFPVSQGDPFWGYFNLDHPGHMEPRPWSPSAAGLPGSGPREVPPGDAALAAAPGRPGVRLGESQGGRAVHAATWGCWPCWRCWRCWRCAFLAVSLFV